MVISAQRSTLFGSPSPLRVGQTSEATISISGIMPYDIGALWHDGEVAGVDWPFIGFAPAVASIDFRNLSNVPLAEHRAGHDRAISGK